MSYEADELRRSWKNCTCPIYVSGTLGARFRRKNTERATWDEAKSLVHTWEEAGSWDGTVTLVPPVIQVPEPAPAATEGRVTIERAIEAYLTDLTHAAANTLKKYKQLLKRLKAFSDSRGFVMIDQWGPVNVREFRSSWSISPQSAAKSMSTLKAFFEFCVSNEWLTRNPARLVKNPRGRDAADRRSEQKLPFSDPEILRMYDACETKYGKQEVKWSRVIHHQRVEGEYARYNFKMDGSGSRGFHLCFGLYRPAHR